MDGQVVDEANHVIAVICWFAEFGESCVKSEIVLLSIQLGLVCMPRIV